MPKIWKGLGFEESEEEEEDSWNVALHLNLEEEEEEEEEEGMQEGLKSMGRFPLCLEAKEWKEETGYGHRPLILRCKDESERGERGGLWM